VGQLGQQDAAFVNPHSSTWSNPALVAWPAAGYFPHQLTHDGVCNSAGDWSVSTGSDAISFAGASVAGAKNSSPVAVTTIPQSTLSSRFGDRAAFAFRFAAGVVTLPAPGQVDNCRVTISNITGYGAYQYEAKVFNAMGTVTSVEKNRGFVAGLVSPRLWSDNGEQTASLVGSGQVLRVCRGGGDLLLYSFDPAATG
jgi:hypothetical protein